MTRSALLSLALPLLLTACPGGGGDDSEGGSTTMTSINLTLATGSSSSSGDPTLGPEPTTTGDTDTDTGSTTEVLNCGIQDIQVKAVIPNVMLVLDKSGSMIAAGKSPDPGEIGDGFWDHDNDPNTGEVTRWQSLHEVVEAIVTASDASFNLGAMLFPSTAAKADYSEAACVTDMTPLVAVGPMSGAAILGAIPAADDTSLKGGTPAGRGVAVAVAELQGVVDPNPDDPAPKVIILVTDGAANCTTDAPDNNTLFEVYDDKLPMVVADALAQGIPTYVVGIDILDMTSPTLKDGNPDNTNTYEKLNMLAEAGGTARAGDEKFYNSTNQIELQAALDVIKTEITSCLITLDPPPKDSSPFQFIKEVNVGSEGNSEGYPGEQDQVADCATESGWHYTKDDRSEIELCGAACELFKMTGKIQVVLDCTFG